MANAQNLKIKKLLIIAGAVMVVILIVWLTISPAKTPLKGTTPTTNNTETENSPTPQPETSKNYDPAKVAMIANFNRASSSLKDALMGKMFDDAKLICEQAKSIAPQLNTSWYLNVKKMVRDDFAGVQFCGLGSDSILAHSGSEWKVLGSVAGDPECNVIDEYKVSREIISECYLDATHLRDVTYP